MSEFNESNSPAPADAEEGAVAVGETSSVARLKDDEN